MAAPTAQDITNAGYITSTDGTQYKLGSQEATNFILGGGAKVSQTQKAPTVLTNQNVIDSNIPDNNNKLVSIGDVQNSAGNGRPDIYDGQGKLMATWNGNTKQYQNVTPGTPNATNGLNENSSPEDVMKALYGGNNLDQETNSEVKNSEEYKLVQGLNLTHDAEYNSLVQNIQNLYKDKINKLDASQKASTASINQSLSLSGSDRYAPVSSQGILDSKTRADVDAMTTLQNEEQDLIAKAQSAKSLQDEQSVNDLLKLYDKKHTELLDQAQKVKDQFQKDKDNINALALKAKEGGAPDSVVTAITNSASYAEGVSKAGDYLQTATGQLGDYLQYKKETTANGLTPIDYQTYKDQQDAKVSKLKASEAYSTAYGSEMGKAAADKASGGYGGTSAKEQEAMEKDFKNTLLKEFSTRSGTYGLNDAKVSQANKLATLFNQSYDPKTGNYNIAKSQYGELAIGLANLISGGTGASDTQISDLKQATAKGDWNKVYTYVTGSPANASSQQIINLLASSVEREAQQAMADRQTDETKLIGLAPTDLDPSRREALIKAQSIQYIGIKGAAKNEVDNYIKKNPDKAENIAKMYEVPGATDEAIWQYIQQNQ